VSACDTCGPDAYFEGNLCTPTAFSAEFLALSAIFILNLARSSRGRRSRRRFASERLGVMFGVDLKLSALLALWAVSEPAGVSPLSKSASDLTKFDQSRRSVHLMETSNAMSAKTGNSKLTTRNC